MYTKEIQGLALVEYKSGKNVREICAKYNISRSCLYKWVYVNEVRRDKKTENEFTYKQLEILQRQVYKLIREYELLRFAYEHLNPSLKQKLGIADLLNGRYKTKEMCRVIQVDHSTFYNHDRRGVKITQNQLRNERLKEKILEVYNKTVIKCTIGLTKDFNRLSAYIGINSEKRFSEISQTQAVERNTLYREYIVVGKQETPDNGCLIGNKLLAMIADTFTQNGGYSPLSNACAWGTSYQGTDVANGVAINLPVISSAFGNSISFSWRYADNYFAGDISVFEANAFTSGDVSGYFQNSQPYTDYYGRLYYYDFDLQLEGPTVTATNLTELGGDLPQGTKPTESSGYVSTVGQTPYIMRKDNREALQVNFQIDFVTNLENFIIGSALSSYCPAVRGSGNVNDSEHPLTARLYVFDTDLDKFTDHVEAYEQVDLSTMESAEVTVKLHKEGYFIVNAGAFPTTESGATSGKSWAIITTQSSISKEVEDETGETSTQTTFYGDDLLIGQNIEVTAGQAFTPIYFAKKREIFNKTVWEDKQ